MAARGTGNYLTKREGFWHYVRRVPLAVAGTDKRTFARQTTKIRVADDPRGIRAARAAEQINADTERHWRAILEGRAVESKVRYEAARKRARAFGFDYASASVLAERPVIDILERLERLVETKSENDETAVAALLGMETPPDFMLSDLFEEYEKLERASIADLSEDQKRKWRNPKKRALANLQSRIGDKALSRISRTDALDFREWWQDRVLEENVEIATANKDFGHLNRMLKTIERKHRIGLAPLFSDLRIEGEVTGSRKAFTADYIRDTLLKLGALTELNEEARDAFYVMVETGLRLSEIVNLVPSTIMLDAGVPHVSVRADGRRMKTPQSERDQPLVGIALEAMQRRAEGFPRYRDNAAALSATVNKFLTENELRPSVGHTMYSLRHTFEDRLTAVGTPDKVMAALMGHKYHRPKYGSGPSLELKAEWLHRIAFKGVSIV